MKLTYALMKERIPAIGTLSLDGRERFSLEYEAGIVTVSPKDERLKDKVYLVPLANVAFMEADRAKK